MHALGPNGDRQPRSASYYYSTVLKHQVCTAACTCTSLMMHSALMSYRFALSEFTTVAELRREAPSNLRVRLPLTKPWWQGERVPKVPWVPAALCSWFIVG